MRNCMKQKNKRLLKKYIGYILTVVCVLTGVVYIGNNSLQNIKNSQYIERVESSNLLMEKISQNIMTAINFNWQSAHNATELIENESVESLEELLENVKFYETILKESADTNILLIDDTGYCHASDGSTFKWMSQTMLNNTEDQMYVSEKQFSTKNGIQMHYLTSFKEPLVIEGVTYTHISLACDMNELDTFFNISNYGEDSVTFIIHKDGSQVYREERNNNFSGVYNIFSTLKKAEFGYGKTYEDFKKDIDNDVNDSVFLTIYDTDYYVCYYTLELMDWVILLLVPAELVSGGTQAFTEEIAASIITLCAIFLVILLSVIAYVIRQINKKQKEVNDGLKRVAEAERKANEAKTNFLSSMSHDIRTPMNAITGMVMLASHRVEDTEYIEDCLEKIGLASEHLLTLINNILDISKVESGKMMLNQDNFSLTESFSNLVNIMQPQIKERRQELSVQVHNVQHENLYGDKLRLNQIFINLFSNAVKYTQKEGKISVDLYQEQIDGEDNKVRIIYVVKDNGMGMSKKFQETMYETFSRATDSRTSKTQGSGLGLAICKQMVELMGGTIDCESELGVGTTFTVTIDMPIADIKEDLRFQETELESFSLEGVRLLVAEDNDMNWEIAHAVLEMQGIVTDRAEDGKMCVDMINCSEENYYSLVLMDVRMPIMDGREATRMLRKSDKEWVRKIPIVAMTADAFAEDVQECLDAGMNEHIAKPLDMERLLHILCKYCAK